MESRNKLNHEADDEFPCNRFLALLQILEINMHLTSQVIRGLGFYYEIEVGVRDVIQNGF
jgi:hypothetical protein